MYSPQQEQEVPVLFRRYFDESELSYKPWAHPFGVQIKQYQAIRNLTLDDIEHVSGVSKSVISRMCNGKRLEGTRSRRNILLIIDALRRYEVLEYVEEANQLLDSAGQHLLEYGNEEDTFLLNNLATTSDSSEGSESTVATVLEEVEIYDGAAQYLVENGSKDVRVYAPLALWQPSLYKKEHWFAVLAEYLSSNLDAQVQMVFGVPHRRGSYEYMKDTLSVFQALEQTAASSRKRPSISIHYIPPIRHQEPPPAIGMIVFDSEVVAIGFGVRDAMEKIDTGWVLFDEDAARTAKDWFDCKIWPKYQSYELMRTQPRLKRMNDGFGELEQKYAEQFTEDW